MTRSIYGVPPHFKRGGRLTRACTEILFPELAVVRTQNGVPTIRKTLARTPLFLPEYMALARFLYSGTMSRLLKWTDSNKTYFKWSENASAIMTILNKPPYADWFASPGTMRTGHLYNGDALNALLSGAKGGASRYVPVLGRIVNQELACRWVYQDAKSSQSGP
jgi:hypothetical protein